MHDRKKKMVVVPRGRETHSVPSGQSRDDSGLAYDLLGSGLSTDEQRMKEDRPVMKSSNEIGSRDLSLETTTEPDTDGKPVQHPQSQREVGGPKGLEPTRYGDWEKGGRCIDF